jgi:hypothetical protein
VDRQRDKVCDKAYDKVCKHVFHRNLTWSRKDSVNRVRASPPRPVPAERMIRPYVRKESLNALLRSTILTYDFGPFGALSSSVVLVLNRRLFLEISERKSALAAPEATLQPTAKRQ